MKKIFKAVLALMMAFGIQVAALSNVNAAKVDLSQPGTYEVPVKSLVSKAPLQPVQDAFAKAFGDSIVVTVDDEGNQVATITLQHMIVDMSTWGMSKFHANIKTVEGATVISTKQELSSEPGKDNDGYNITLAPVDTNTEVPNVIKLPLNLDSEAKQVITLTVDFMDYLMGSGSSYPTEVTLSLDVENITDVTPEPEPEEPEYTLADGTYTVASDVLKINSDEQSMAAQAVKSAVVTSKNGTILVTLQMGAVSVYGQTAYIDKMEVEQADGTYKEADITGHDSDGNVSELQFTLAINTKLTNVKFYYGGSNRGAEARLSLDLENPTLVSPVESSKFAKDGTYTVDVALWNADRDQASMAASALDKEATVVVKNGVATMYITTKEMTLGTIKASLQELYIGSINGDYKSNPAKIEAKDAAGNPILWSFELPSEEEYFDVVVNPHVEIMGNADIAARMKVDYSTLKYVSDQIDAPKAPETNGSTSTGNNTTTPETSGNDAVVKTGDNANVELIGGLLVSSLAIAGYVIRKRLCK